MVASAADNEDQFPDEPIPRKRVPAGRAVLITVVTLALVVFLDADGLTRTAERQEPGWSRTAALAVMHPIQDISSALRLNRPRRWLAAATGHVDDTEITPTGGVELADAPRQSEPSASTGPSISSEPVVSTTTTTTVPTYRTPTRADPLRILVAGDSLSGHLGPALSRALRDYPVKVTLDENVGTGLARPDVVDWPSVLKAHMAKNRPDVVVLFLGGNDDQDLRTATGWIPITHSEEWKAEYQRRVAQVMNIVTEPGVTLYWIGLPAMDKAHLQRYVPTINSLTKTEASARPRSVVWVDSGRALNAKGGGFATYLGDESGHKVMVREPDGVHPTVAGMDRIVDLFVDDLIRTRHLDAPPPPPSTTSP